MDPLQTFATFSQELSAVSVHTKLSSTTIIQSCNYEHGHICIHDHQIDVVESSGCDVCQMYQSCESGSRFPPTVDEDPELSRTDLYDLKAHHRHICRQTYLQDHPPGSYAQGKFGSEGLIGVIDSAAAVEDPVAGGTICSAAGGRGTSFTPSTTAVEDREGGVDLQSRGAGSKPGAAVVHPSGSGVDFGSFGAALTTSTPATPDRGSGAFFGGGSAGSTALLGRTASAAGSTVGAVTAQEDLGGDAISTSAVTTSTAAGALRQLRRSYLCSSSGQASGVEFGSDSSIPGDSHYKAKVQQASDLSGRLEIWAQTRNLNKEQIRRVLCLLDPEQLRELPLRR